jgi:hypothetical protein
MQDLAIDTPPSVAPPKLEPTITQYETLPAPLMQQVIQLEEVSFPPCERLGPHLMAQQAALRTSGLLLAEMCARANSQNNKL